MILWPVLIYLEHESALHPHSFKGNVKSGMKQPSALVSRQSNPIRYGHPRQSALQKKPKEGVCLSVCCHEGVRAPFREHYIEGEYSYYDSSDKRLCVFGRQIHPESLDTASSNSSELAPLWFWEMLLLLRYYDCTTAWYNSVGVLICDANDCCLMHNPFSVTQMVSWQQTACYKIALWMGTWAEQVLNGTTGFVFFFFRWHGMRQASVQKRTLHYKIIFNSALSCWPAWTFKSSGLKHELQQRWQSRCKLWISPMTNQAGYLSKIFWDLWIILQVHKPDPP